MRFTLPQFGHGVRLTVVSLLVSIDEPQSVHWTLLVAVLMAANVKLRGCRAFAAFPLERRVGHYFNRFSLSAHSDFSQTKIAVYRELQMQTHRHRCIRELRLADREQHDIRRVLF